MKRLLMLLAAVVLVFAGCSNKPAEGTATPQTTESTEEKSTDEKSTEDTKTEDTKSEDTTSEDNKDSEAK